MKISTKTKNRLFVLYLGLLFVGGLGTLNYVACNQVTLCPGMIE